LTVVDTNIILDISGDETRWLIWASEQLAAALERGPVIINDVIFAELCAHQSDVTAVEALIADFGLMHMPMSRRALFLAGKAHASYRKSGGPKLNVLPDFFIGAQAVDLKVPLLTRDTRRYRSYFPELELIAPETPGIG
jgi:predicted nucleic acid-binding protein